jgi:hypothetical protein
VIDALLASALSAAKAKAVPIYSFALYHDSESSAFSVCIDTHSNSLTATAKSNAFTSEYFGKYVTERDYKSAVLWQPIFRNASLGDYAYANIASVDTDIGHKYTESDVLEYVIKIRRLEGEILSLSPNPRDVLFSCSTPDDEFGICWLSSTSLTSR